MDFGATHISQCPAPKGMVRRKLEEKYDTPCNSKAELSVEATTSGPKVFLSLCCCVCRDCGLCRAHHPARGVYEDDSSQCLCAVCVEVEDMQRGKDKAEAASAQMPNTKHKARASVACRQLTDGNEAAAPRDRSPQLLLSVIGTVSLANLDPRVTPSLQASNQDHADVYKQEQEKVETKGERSMNTTVDHKHTESTLSYVWEQPRIKAYDCNLEPGRRTKSLHNAGIFPQEQICRERFCGTPFRLQ